jgi:hypothetical protein
LFFEKIRLRQNENYFGFYFAAVNKKLPKGEKFMHYYPHFLQFLFLAFVVVTVVIAIAYRQEIRFRWNYGMWPREEGAVRIVARRLESVFKARYDISEAISNANEALRECPDSIPAIRAKSKALKKLQRRSRCIDRRIEIFCDLAEKFNHGYSIKIAEDNSKRARARIIPLRRKAVGDAMMEI